MVTDLNSISRNSDEFKDRKTVLIGGCFDIFHFGHLQFLKKAKEQGDYLIVLLESDEFIREKKQREPVHNQEERAEILSSNAAVDLVVKIPMMNDQDYWEAIQIIKPKVIAITEGDKYAEQKKKQAESVGGELRVVTPLIKDFSSTKITNNNATISSS